LRRRAVEGAAVRIDAKAAEVKEVELFRGD